jgi:hypothetical protein
MQRLQSNLQETKQPTGADVSGQIITERRSDERYSVLRRVIIIVEKRRTAIQSIFRGAVFHSLPQVKSRWGQWSCRFPMCAASYQEKLWLLKKVTRGGYGAITWSLLPHSKALK